MNLSDGIQELMLQNTAVIRGFTAPDPVVLNGVRAAIFQRIVNQGQNTALQQIGNYSTRDTLVGAKSFINKGTANKFFSKKRDWVALSGPRYLAKLSGGYRALRNLEQRQSRFVDLFFSGTMMRDFAVEMQGKDIVFGFRNPVNGLKMRGNEKRFGGPIISLSQDEIQLLTQSLI